MPRTKSTTVYLFDELDDKAKERARDWYRQASAEDFSQYGDDHVLEDAATICAILGITLKQNAVPLVSGKTRQEPAIIYSGFSTQGSGACFEGTYAYKDCVTAIREHAPEDQELHRIADELTNLQAVYAGQLTATIEHTDHHYAHSRTVTITVYAGDDEVYRGDEADGDAERLREALRDLMDWIYKQLEQEYDYQQSDEYVDENIRANEYEFTADGRRSCV